MSITAESHADLIDAALVCAVAVDDDTRYFIMGVYRQGLAVNWF